jgi:hypothetical protein
VVVVKGMLRLLQCLSLISQAWKSNGVLDTHQESTRRRWSGRRKQHSLPVSVEHAAKRCLACYAQATPQAGAVRAHYSEWNVIIEIGFCGQWSIPARRFSTEIIGGGGGGGRRSSYNVTG